MKTFEERYTAWIDGELEGNALSAFEQELTRRAAEGEAEADKADASRLRTLLQDHLQAPALTNPDFFSHQLRERIEADLAASSRGREPVRRSEPGLFAWGFARLAGLGAACLFAAAALYYGMMPPRSATVSDPVAVNPAPTAAGTQVAANDSPAPVAPSAPENRDAPGEIQVVQLSPTPPPIDLSADIKASPDIKTFVPDQPANPTTITPLHYTKPNVNVLWLNGLDYMPDVPDVSASPVAATPAPPAAAASASP